MRLRCETRRRFKVKSALLCAVLCVVVCSVLYSLDVFSLRNVTFPGRHYSPQRTYRVLMWHSFKHDFFDRIFGPDAVKECPFACNFSQDRAELDRSDVVVLQSFFKSFWKSLPRRRRAGQGWLLYAMEPPHRLPSNPSRLDELGINWTLSYRFDADVVHRHSFRTVRRRTSVERVFAPQPKARPVAWIVSNCESFSRRESYVRELQKVLHGQNGGPEAPQAEPSSPTYTAIWRTVLRGDRDDDIDTSPADSPTVATPTSPATCRLHQLQTSGDPACGASVNSTTDANFEMVDSNREAAAASSI
ncbi:hypothetical protein MTO96_019032 [Rhipicephalus appendiculatus]